MSETIHYIEAHNLNVRSSFPITTVHKGNLDIDYWIDIQNRGINLIFEGMDSLPMQRLQMPTVRYIVLRSSEDPLIPMITLHFLLDSGRQSSFLNFELDCRKFSIELIEEFSSAHVIIRPKIE